MVFGGLCCAGLLARYNQDVLVLESHDLPEGTAHSFDIKDYKFDSGPSLFSGFESRGSQANPLAQVFVTPLKPFYFQHHAFRLSIVLFRYKVSILSKKGKEGIDLVLLLLY